VLLLVPLLASTADTPSKVYAFVGLVWKPLPSPSPVTGALALGAKSAVLVIGPAMAMLKLLVAVTAGEAESVTRTVKVDAAAVVGVPVMLPAALSVRPAGSVPLAIDQLYGEIPPLAVKVAV